MSTPRIDLGNGHTHEPKPSSAGYPGPAEGDQDTAAEHTRLTTHPVDTAGCTVCDWPAHPGSEWVPDTDPGPVPEPAPEPAVLTLKQRIANAIDRAYGEANWDRGDPLPDPDYVADIVHAEVAAGADYSERPDNVELTPAQALAYLLDLPEWSRLDRLGRLLDQAHAASRCFAMNHQGQEESLKATLARERRYLAALDRIARLTSTVDQPESDQGNIIGRIAAEALVQQ